MVKKNSDKPKYIAKTLTITLNDGTTKRVKVRGKSEREAQKKLDKLKLEYEMGLIAVNGNTSLKNGLKAGLRPIKSQKLHLRLIEKSNA